MYCPLPVAPHLLKFKGCVIVGVDFSIQQVSISLTLNAITRFIIHTTASALCSYSVPNDLIKLFGRKYLELF